MEQTDNEINRQKNKQTMKQKDVRTDRKNGANLQENKQTKEHTYK